MVADKHDILSLGTYILPTPAGAFKALSDTSANLVRNFLVTLLKKQGTARTNDISLGKLAGLSTPLETYEFIKRLQTLGWIQTVQEPYIPPTAPIQSILSTLLPILSRENKILLADTQGFYLHSHGFPHEVAEELSALSAEIANMHARRAGALNRNLGFSSSAWALSDAAGHSQLGFWPLFVGSERFVLVIAGSPAFNQPQFVELAFALHNRFGN